MVARRTNTETRWHDRGTVTLVPAGEIVDVIRLDAVPSSDRTTIAEGIRQYEKQGRKFVPIKIRDWYAMIDETLLTH